MNFHHVMQISPDINDYCFNVDETRHKHRNRVSNGAIISKLSCVVFVCVLENGWSRFCGKFFQHVSLHV